MPVSVNVGPANFGHHCKQAVTICIGSLDGSVSVSYCEVEEVEYLIKQLQMACDELRRRKKEHA